MITEQDVEDRLNQAEHEFNAFVSWQPPQSWLRDAYWAQVEELRLRWISWRGVRDRVKSGIKPIIAVMERE